MEFGGHFTAKAVYRLYIHWLRETFDFTLNNVRQLRVEAFSFLEHKKCFDSRPVDKFLGQTTEHGILVFLSWFCWNPFKNIFYKNIDAEIYKVFLNYCLKK